LSAFILPPSPSRQQGLLRSLAAEAHAEINLRGRQSSMASSTASQSRALSLEAKFSLPRTTQRSSPDEYIPKLKLDIFIDSKFLLKESGQEFSDYVLRICSFVFFIVNMLLLLIN
jgi:hypothetical protein